MARSDGSAVECRDTDGTPDTAEDGPARRARRRKSDQVDRNDSFILHKFEALRPGRTSTRGHPDGDELDTDRAVRSQVDIAATGEGTDRVWRQTRAEKRDLAVSILLDVSRSTEAAIPGHGHDGRTVIDVEREALAAFAWGLDACGDDFAIHAFSSLKRQRVYLQTAKDFGTPMAAAVEARIAALKPGFYTRLGAGTLVNDNDDAATAQSLSFMSIVAERDRNTVVPRCPMTCGDRCRGDCLASAVF